MNSKKLLKRITAVLLSAAMVLSLAACSGNSGSAGTEGAGAGAGMTINIGYQNGMAYAPLYLMEKKQLVEKYLPGATVKFTKADSGSAIGESLTSGALDFGCVGSSPMLTGWDKDCGYKIFSGLCCLPMGLYAKQDKFNSLEDFEKGKDKIAVPAVGSIQDILLSMICEKKLGDASALKENVLGLKHPEAMQTLLNNPNDLAGHFATPPYNYMEEEDGCKQIVNASEAFDGEDFSFMLIAATEKIMEENPTAGGAVYMALSEAMDLISNEDAEAVKIISEVEGIDEETVKEYLEKDGTIYSTTVYGMMKFAEFMHDNGIIEKEATSVEDFSFATVNAAVGERAGGQTSVEKAQLSKNAK